MDQLIEVLINSPEFGGYIFSLCLICRVFVTIAPAKWTEKIPDAVMMIISALALASNKRVDNKGNLIK